MTKVGNNASTLLKLLDAVKNDIPVLERLLKLVPDALDLIRWLNTIGGDASQVSRLEALLNDLIATSLRSARIGAEESRALQDLKKKIDRGDAAFRGLPKTQETANDIIREVFNSPNPIVKTGISRNGQPYTDVFNPATGRGVRIIDNQFDTFVNLN